MIKRIASLAVILLFFMPSILIASEGEALIEDSLNRLDLSGIDTVLSGDSFEDIIVKAVNGTLDLSPESLIESTVSVFLSEIRTLVSLMRNMLIITLLCAILRNLSASFSKKSVSELAFFINFIIIVMILISSFNAGLSIMRDLISTECSLMEAAVPVMITMLAVSGNVTSAYILNPVIAFVITAISRFVRDILAPVINVAAILHLLNFISEKNSLSKLSEFMIKTISWVLKGSAVLFMFIFSLQGISAPIINNAAVKTARSALNVVPVVGAVLSGTVDSVLYWTGAVKSGLMVALIFVVFMLCLVPILKLAAFIAVFKITAAVLQPVGDSRVVSAVDSIGSYMGLILGASVTVSVMFIFMIMIMLGGAA